MKLSRVTLARAGAAAAFAAGTVAVLAAPATAVVPSKTAWWNELPAGVLPGPLVGANELAVGDSPSGPTAIAALAYQVGPDVSADPGSAGATLVLPLNTSSSVGTPAVEACPVSPSATGWQAGGNQSGAPPDYSCSAAVAGQLSPDGSKVTFALSPSQQEAKSPGTFNLVIAPTSGSFEAVFEVPPDSGFTVTNPPSPGGGPAAGSSPADSTGVAAPAGPAPAAAGADSGALAPPLTAAAPSASPAPAAAPAASTTGARGSAGQGSIQPVASATPGLLHGRRQQLFGVWLMVDSMIVLALFGGGPARAPRLLGSLGSRAPAPEPESPSEETVIGGIGRFARPRSGPPRRI
ncbi:MAG TPA: hypothetical protein VE990_09265 [Acidimicrobiales bacterium]|nr:hypothetical protein [Acidimicrobiales bacterium]